jgi:hypothetical protein
MHRMCDLDLGRRDLNFMCDSQSYNDEHLCRVILKLLYACRSFAPDKCFLMSSKCDLDWIMPIMVVNISIKYYKNSSMHVGDMLQTKSGYLI